MAKKAKKAEKRGRKPGVKVGPYKLSFGQMLSELKDIKARLIKLEKVIG